MSGEFSEAMGVSGADYGGEMEKFLTPKQLSELLQVDLSTVYLWTHTEFIPHYKLGRCVRFIEGDVQEWLRHRKSAGRRTMKYDINMS